MFRTSGDRKKPLKLCPGCNALDTIIFSEPAGKQQDLFGRPLKAWRSIPGGKCTKCGSVQEKGYKYKEVVV